MPSMNGLGSSGATERVAPYLRVSSEEQRERETIDLQREFLEQYRNLYELEVSDVYGDDGVSGTIPLHERPEGRRLLADAKEGKFQTVLVKKLDRLGRTLGDGFIVRHGYCCENTIVQTGWWHTAEDWYVTEGETGGSRVYAVAAGEVVFAGYDYPGLVIMIQPGPERKRGQDQ
jgi:murein DD-endopeptidase MepM/ murein hydrolase activator NlpD